MAGGGPNITPNQSGYPATLTRSHTHQPRTATHNSSNVSSRRTIIHRSVNQGWKGMGHLRCPTPRTPREHQVARPPGAGTGRAVPDYRSQAKHRRRAQQGRVTPRLELMTLGGTVDRPLNSDTDRAGCGPCQLQSCTSKLVAPVLV